MTTDLTAPIFTKKRIVYATDFLESSRLALDYAAGFAYRYDATILMVHAIELTQPAREAEMVSGKASLLRKSAEERIEALAAGVRRLGIQVEVHLEEGNPWDVLLRAADPTRIDLLVLGTHGVHRGLDHLLIGSNTERILLSSCCPTLTVGRHVMGGVDLDLRLTEILYISDFSPEAAAAAPFALMLGRDFGAGVDICQVMPASAEHNAPMREALAKEYSETLRSLLPDGGHRWSSAAFQLDRGMMKEQVLERAKADAAGLIVLGVKSQSHLGRHLHTSFAYQLIAEATCPILTVHCP